jgi:hypothetical protein
MHGRDATSIRKPEGKGLVGSFKRFLSLRWGKMSLWNRASTGSTVNSPDDT